MDYIQWSALWQASKGFGVGFGQGLVFSKMALELKLATQEETFSNLPRMLVKLSFKHCMQEDEKRMPWGIRKEDAPSSWKNLIPRLHLLQEEGWRDGITIACAILEWTKLIFQSQSIDNASLCTLFNASPPTEKTLEELYNFVQKIKEPPKDAGTLHAKPFEKNPREQNNMQEQPTKTSAPWGTLGALCGGVAAYQTIQFTHTRALHAYALLKRLDGKIESRRIWMSSDPTKPELLKDSTRRKQSLYAVGMSLAVLVWLASKHDAETIMRGLRRVYPSLGV